MSSEPPPTGRRHPHLRFRGRRKSPDGSGVFALPEFGTLPEAAPLPETRPAADPGPALPDPVSVLSSPASMPGDEAGAG